MRLVYDGVPFDVVHSGHGHEMDSKRCHHIDFMEDQTVAEQVNRHT
jgi:hypothetical protein